MMRGAVAGILFLAAPVTQGRTFDLMLHWNGPDAAQPLEGSWSTLAGKEYVVETASDLSDWSLLHEMKLGDGSPTLQALPWTNDRRFFRVWELSPSNKAWVTPEAVTPLASLNLFRSPALNRPVSYHIMLPTSYATQPERRYPVIYWLHGSGGGIDGIAQLANFFSNAMTAGRMPHALVVFPNGLPNSMWCDSKDGATPVETIVIDELIPHVDRSYRTIASRAGRIVEGFSMGGHGAGRYGFKFSQTFRASSLLGAGPLQLDFLENDPDLQPIELRRALFAQVYDSDMNYYLAQHPRTWAESRAGQLPADHRIRIVVGTADTMLGNNRELRDHLIALGIPHDYIEVAGVGHSPLPTLTGANNADFYQSVLSGAE